MNIETATIVEGGSDGIQDRVQALGAELCDLLSRQLELLDPEKIAQFSAADQREYNRRRHRIAELTAELTGFTAADFVF